MELNFNGVENPGALCFMISVLQQFSMMENFRDIILQWPSDFVCETHDHRFFVSECKRLFQQLQESGKRTVSLLPWLAAFQAAGSHIFNLHEQRDASEFLRRFIRTIEMVHELHFKSFNPCATEHIVGKLSFELTSIGDLYSKTTERFHIIPLAVGGDAGNNLEASLEHFTANISIDYKWTTHVDGPDPSTSSTTSTTRKVLLPTKRIVTFEVLPRHLLFQLCRFTFERSTGTTRKVNKRFRFPVDLDMAPYLHQRRSGRCHQFRSKTESDINSTDPNSCTDNDEDNDGKCEERIEGEEGEGGEDDDHDDYEEEIWYELSGVVIHSGTAQSGHYYSIARNRSTGRWFKFDDEDVEEFDIDAHLAEVAFGGRRGRETVDAAVAGSPDHCSVAQGLIGVEEGSFEDGRKTTTPDLNTSWSDGIQFYESAGISDDSETTEHVGTDRSPSLPREPYLPRNPDSAAAANLNALSPVRRGENENAVRTEELPLSSQCAMILVYDRADTN